MRSKLQSILYVSSFFFVLNASCFAKEKVVIQRTEQAFGAVVESLVIDGDHLVTRTAGGEAEYPAYFILAQKPYNVAFEDRDKNGQIDTLFITKTLAENELKFKFISLVRLSKAGSFVIPTNEELAKEEARFNKLQNSINTPSLD